MGHDERERIEGVLKENNESSAGQIVKNLDILWAIEARNFVKRFVENFFEEY